ncbi:hypothetical protein RB195_007893 [Necator americanus]|uniref:Uncharacterized protein n=2 Tax=Necator americanus TaxID=51031 RepID=W2SM41_NECAM|nr:hypothetical protein NECAME_15004 [Necator americanus]ETN69936.1 hypothetical protein NECAME_15004 [Necator americanus]
MLMPFLKNIGNYCNVICIHTVAKHLGRVHPACPKDGERREKCLEKFCKDISQLFKKKNLKCNVCPIVMKEIKEKSNEELKEMIVNNDCTHLFPTA